MAKPIRMVATTHLTGDYYVQAVIELRNDYPDSLDQGKGMVLRLSHDLLTDLLEQTRQGTPHTRTAHEVQD